MVEDEGEVWRERSRRRRRRKKRKKWKKRRRISCTRCNSIRRWMVRSLSRLLLRSRVGLWPVMIGPAAPGERERERERERGGEGMMEDS